MSFKIGKLRIEWDTPTPVDEHLERRRVADHNFWIIRNPLFHGTRRILAFNHKVHVGTLSMKDSDLMAIAESGIQATDQGSISKCGFLFHTMKAQLSLYCTERTLFDIANPIILIDGEPFEKITKKHSELKKHLFDTIPEVRAFFFSTAHRFLALMSMLSSDTDVEGYLKSREYKSIDDLFTSWLTTEVNGGNSTSKKT